LGFPVVVKVDGPAHKSVAGGVVLGITTLEEVASVTERLGEAVIVARQVRSGREIICGVHRDVMFGPVVSIGVGGALAEALGTSGIWLAPLSQSDAEQLVASVPGSTEITGSAYTDLVQLLLALSRLSLEHPEVEEIDVNPLVLDQDGAVAVDALVIVGTVPMRGEDGSP
jgi:acetyltransferase